MHWYVVKCSIVQVLLLLAAVGISVVCRAVIFGAVEWMLCFDGLWCILVDWIQRSPTVIQDAASPFHYLSFIHSYTNDRWKNGSISPKVIGFSGFSCSSSVPNSWASGLRGPNRIVWRPHTLCVGPEDGVLVPDQNERFKQPKKDDGIIEADMAVCIDMGCRQDSELTYFDKTYRHRLAVSFHVWSIYVSHGHNHLFWNPEKFTWGSRFRIPSGYLFCTGKYP